MAVQHRLNQAIRTAAPSTPIEVQKSQEVRLFDAFLLGPFLIGMALISRPPPLLRVLLGVAGAGTILYNLRNYQLTREQASVEAARNT
jgi:hypothetical protein